MQIDGEYANTLEMCLPQLKIPSNERKNSINCVWLQMQYEIYMILTTE